MLQQPEIEKYFVPQLPESCPLVHISLSLIQRLEFDVVEAFKSVPKRGLEIGGILLGRVLPGSINDFRPTILVEDYEAIESEHEQGPSYLLSGRDKLDFEQAVSRQRRQPPGELRPVGFFRSHTRGDFEFDEHDISVVQGLFSREPSVCVLVKPTAVGLSLGRVGIWKQSSLDSFETFPFKVAALEEGGFPITSALPEPEIQVPDAAASLPSEETALPVTHRFPRWQFGWVRDSAVLLGLAAALLLAAYLTRSPRNSAVRVTAVMPAKLVQGDAISLNVEHRNGSTVLSWDRGSAAMQRAESGLLLIQDAGKRQVIHLDRSELDAGRIVYVPASNDASYRMQLTAAEPSLVASAAPAPVDVPNETEAAQPSPELPAAEVASPHRARKRRQTDDALKASLDIHRPSPFSPPQTARITNPPAPAPASVPQPKAAAEPRLVPDPETAPPALIAQDRVVTSVSVESAGKSGLKKIFSKVSPEHLFHEGGEHQTPAPRALREVQPKLSPDVVSDLHSPTEVDVKVTIGWNGFVMKAQVKEHDVDNRIAQAVVRAAREWAFEPVRDENGPMDRHAVIHFSLKRTTEITASNANL